MKSKLGDMVSDWMATFKYKPLWTFEVIERRNAEGRFVVAVQSSYPSVDVLTGKPDNVYGTMTVSEVFLDMPPRRAREAFFAMLRQTLQAGELHELDEWFTVNGKRPYDPHRPDPHGAPDF